MDQGQRLDRDRTEAAAPPRSQPLLPEADDPVVPASGPVAVPDAEPEPALPEAALPETVAPERAPMRHRPSETEDLARIQRLKYRYLRALDTKSWDEFAGTLVPEATATYSEYLQFESRDAFLAFLHDTLGPHVITEHRCDHPEIDIDGDTATGIWYLADTVLIPGHNMLLHGAAYYNDRYVRCSDGEWRIAHTGYERTYEVTVSLSDMPSLRLTAGRWGQLAEQAGMADVQRDPGTAGIRREPPTAAAG